MHFSYNVMTKHIGKTSIFYLGQAGFILKTKLQQLIGLDLYLSNCCERIYGFKRLMPQILSADDLIFDYLLVTHSHEDHLDIDSIGTLCGNNRTKLICSFDSYKVADKLLIKRVYPLKVDDYIEFDNLRVTAIFCDHGKEMPDAIGMIIKIDDRKILVTGDTCLRIDKLDEIKEKGPFDVLILPINGKFGNLDEYDAVKLCNIIKPKLVIPSHYWNFMEHGGNPQMFVNELKRVIPNQNYLIMAMGESFVL